MPIWRILCNLAAQYCMNSEDNHLLCLKSMNIEVFREYCLSLGEVEEKLPFAKMRGGDTVLAFYVNGHTFCYCNMDDFRTVVVKCQTERIPELMETTQGVCPPDNHFNSKYWIGLEIQLIEAGTLKELVANSYEIVRTKYKRHGTKTILSSF